MGLGPLVQLAMLLNPQTLPTALLGSALIFISFTLAALLTRKRLYLYLGGEFNNHCFAHNRNRVNHITYLEICAYLLIVCSRSMYTPFFEVPENKKKFLLGYM